MFCCFCDLLLQLLVLLLPLCERLGQVVQMFIFWCIFDCRLAAQATADHKICATNVPWLGQAALGPLRALTIYFWPKLHIFPCCCRCYCCCSCCCCCCRYGVASNQGAESLLHSCRCCLSLSFSLIRDQPRQLRCLCVSLAGPCRGRPLPFRPRGNRKR